MTIPPLAEPSADRIAAARRAYDSGISQREIARGLGMSRTTLSRRLRSWGWPERKAATARAAMAAESAPAAASAGRPDLDDQALRLERLVAGRIDGLERQAAGGHDPHPERTDRRLVQLERLLAQLRKRRGHDGEPDDSPARSVAELRDDLLRHLERIRQDGRTRRLARRAHASGAVAAAAPLAGPDEPARPVAPGSGRDR
jgi:transcriptional regulator with XRE-family HTH domain